MTPRRTQETGAGNLDGRDSFPSTALAVLEGRVENGEQAIDDLKKAIAEVRESSSEIRKAGAADRLAVMAQFTELKVYIAAELGKLTGRAEAQRDGHGDMKWLIGTVVALAALALSLWGVLRR